MVFLLSVLGGVSEKIGSIRGQVSEEGTEELSVENSLHEAVDSAEWEVVSTFDVLETGW